MRLLLDEMYSSEIARQLRSRGYDAVAVSEQPDLIGASDKQLVADAFAARRVILTNNVGDFAPLASTLEHFGMLFTSDRSLPRSRQTIGRYVDTLATFMDAHKQDDALSGQWLWLTPASG